MAAEIQNTSLSRRNIWLVLFSLTIVLALADLWYAHKFFWKPTAFVKYIQYGPWFLLIPLILLLFTFFFPKRRISFSIIAVTIVFLVLGSTIVFGFIKEAHVPKQWTIGPSLCSSPSGARDVVTTKKCTSPKGEFYRRTEEQSNYFDTWVRYIINSEGETLCFGGAWYPRKPCDIVEQKMELTACSWETYCNETTP